MKGGTEYQFYLAE